MKKYNKYSAALCFAAISAVFPYGNLYAAEPSDNDVKSVFERVDYSNKQDLGLRAGSFDVRPSVYLAEKYNSNIYASDEAFNKTRSDFITVLRPSVDIKSDWYRHELDFGAMADIGTYLKHSHENYLDYRIYGFGRFDIKRDTSLGLRVNYDNLHEARTSPDDSDGLDPTEYRVIDTVLSYDYSLRRISLLLQAERKNYSFENGETQDFAVIENNLRDRNEDQLKARWAYEFMPNYKVFLEGTYNEVQYDSGSSIDRNSDGYTASVGTDINVTGKAKADVYAKYISRDFQNYAYEDIEDFSFGGNLLWDINGLTSLKLGAERRVEETTISGASSAIVTNGRLRVEHELTRDWLLAASTEWMEYDFQFKDTTQGREDEVMKYGAEVKYLVNRRLSVGLGYNFNQRDSNSEGFDYKENIVALDCKFDI